jgi:hypothetical protein
VRQRPLPDASFARALAVGVRPVEVTTDRAHAYPRVFDEQPPGALHVVDRYANNPIEADHSISPLDGGVLGVVGKNLCLTSVSAAGMSVLFSDDPRAI